MSSSEFSIQQALRVKFNEVGIGWDIKGVIDSEKRIYTINDDTKLISKVFELVSRPVIYSLAAEYNLKVYEPAAQTVYPDFTLEGTLLGPKKVAVDIKSTYRRFLASGEIRVAFTLGSYTAYIRNPTKNILFPYNEYSEHWIVGFIYTRETNIGEPKRVTIENIDAIEPPITEIELIVQEKHKISSDRPGSGNTANIGSINSVIDLREGIGPFSPYGEEVFLDYWRNFMSEQMSQAARRPRPFTDLASYFQWRRENPHETIELPENILNKYSGTEEG